MQLKNVQVIVQQPALPRYRIPLFREWAMREGIELQLLYSDGRKELENGVAEDFSAACVPMWQQKLGSRKIMWHSAQWKSAERAACDVLILSWDVQYLSLVPSLLRARKNGIKTILWGHGFSKNESRIRKFIRDAVGRLADALIFYDFVTAKTFTNSGWPESKIYVAPNSLDQISIQEARAFWLETDRLKNFQCEQGLDVHKNIIYIGRVYPENRLDLLIKALPEISQSHPAVQLLVIGKANEEVETLQQLAASLNVSDKIKWLGEIHEENEIAPYLLSSELFCYPANIGLSIMHAMGYGLPVVTGNGLSSHNPEIHVLRDNENGCLFKHFDDKDLAGKIAMLLESPEKIAMMGTCARDSVLERFTVQKMTDGFMMAIEGVLEKESKWM